MFKVLKLIGLFCNFLGGLILIPEFPNLIPKKITNWFTKRKSFSKNGNERLMAMAFGYKKEIEYQLQFRFGLGLIAFGFFLQMADEISN